MKKITFALVLLTFGMQAQNFPDPYCDIDPTGTTVEEITAVDFGATNITNNDATSILIDKTSSLVDLTAGETFTMNVQGNTAGDFDNNIVAFIDWNQNGVLDDADEIYEIGILSNSTGNDGVSVSMNITVPSAVMLGQTRVRITKIYGDPQSPALINPCAIEMDAFGQGAAPGFGQALDFTVNIETLKTKSFKSDALSVYPVPAKDVLHIKYPSVLNTVKVYNLLGQEVFTKNTADNELELNVSGLTSGIYIVKLFTADTGHSFRMVKE